jgi:8-oxo-dGTP diphosphatase
MTKRKKRFCYDYPRPALTVDIALFTILDDKLQILLIQRKHDPFAGAWALPGGFVDENEPLIDAARRELKEETGITLEVLEPFGTFGDPGRDPRGWTVSVAFFSIINAAEVNLRPADDATSAHWFPLTALPALAFDHDQIIATARAWLQAGLDR